MCGPCNGTVFFRLRLDNRRANLFRNSVHELFLLLGRWTLRVDGHVLGVSRRRAEKIEDRDSIVRVRASEVVLSHVHVDDVRNAGESC